MRADDEVHEQVALTFKNLTYSVDLGKKQGTKMILDGISGCFKPSRLTALFGASGCGKTSLMDVLSRRKTPAPSRARSASPARRAKRRTSSTSAATSSARNMRA